jgi:two-component system cell cycle sensor histidine kinase/response regulator CckA
LSETILLVDDDDAVRDLFVGVLRLRGYQVLEAASGEQAREVFDNFDGRVDLLISDVVMPGLSGPELARVLTLADPTLRLLFVSGYPQEDDALPTGAPSRVGFLLKPFSARQLVERVATLLAG